MSSVKLTQRIAEIQQTLPSTVKLIAISKQVPAEFIRTAYEAGIRDFGESKIQEAALKQAVLQDLPDITWHLIGHLQSNKAAKALELFNWIHSIDSLKLAQRLHQLAADRPPKPNVLLQVKILPDPTKFGWTVPELLADLPALNDCTHLNIQGLMSIPPYGLDPATTSSVFQQTRDLATTIQQTTQQNHWSHLQMHQLSMGMSGDYPLAIAAGATMIRLGTTLFGEREAT